MAVTYSHKNYMTAFSTSYECFASQQLSRPAALPFLSCAHARLSIGLDQAYCPDCRQEFKPQTPEYRSAIAPPSDPIPDENCSCVGVTHEHWVQTYWVKRAKIKHQYYRYCYQPTANIRSCVRHHIPGGNLKSPTAIARAGEIKSAIALGKSPLEIEHLIKSWKQQ